MDKVASLEIRCIFKTSIELTHDCGVPTAIQVPPGGQLAHPVLVGWLSFVSAEFAAAAGTLLGLGFPTGGGRGEIAVPASLSMLGPLFTERR